MLKQKLQLPYSGLFSPGTNFPELAEYAQLGKFILDCFRLDCGIEIFGILVHV